MKPILSDSSELLLGRTRYHRPTRWWLVVFWVLLLHVLVIMGLQSWHVLSTLSAPVSLPAEVRLLAAPEKTATPKASPPAIKHAPDSLPPPIAEPATPPSADAQTSSSASVDASPLASNTETPVASQAIKPAFMFTPPQALRLTYTLLKDGDSANATLSWEPSSQNYEAIYEATKFGFSAIRLASAGTVSEHGLMPVRYSDKRWRKSEIAAHFDAAKGQVTFSNSQPAATWQSAAQDRTSVLIQLAGIALANAKQLEPGTDINLYVASAYELEEWRLKSLGLETIQLPVGELQALHLVRQPRREFDQQLELWLGVAQQYLPVRIKQTDSSGVTEQQLSRIDAR